MGQKKILFSTPIPPLPPTGGGTRSYQMLKVAAGIGDVDLVCFQPLNEQQRKLLKPYCKHIVAPLSTQAESKQGMRWKLQYFFKLLLPFLFSTSELNHELGFFAGNRFKSFPLIRRLYFNWLLQFFKQRNLLPASDYQLNGMFQSAVPAMNNLQTKSYDLVFTDFTYFTPYFLREGLIRYRHLVLNSHNVEFELVKQSLLPTADGVERKWMEFQTALMKKQERYNLQLASLTFCCSETDKKKLQDLLPGASLTEIPNGVDTEFFQPGQLTSNKPSLLFTGTMNYYPNSEAVKWFLQDVFPALRKKHPDLQFIIAGSNAESLAVIGEEGVVVVNNPEDMRPVFDAATLVVVPLQHGSGTRLKILEAAAMQKPIVSTLLGAEGLKGLSPDILLLANTSDEMIQAIDRLINNSSLQSELKSKAYQWVLENYSWKQIGEKAGNELMRLH